MAAPATASQLRVAEETPAYGDRPSDGAFRLFEIASGDWFRTLTEIYKASGFRADEANQHLAELLAHEYVTKHPVKTFKPGGQIELVLPTQIGLQKLREANVRPAPVRGDAPHGDSGDATHIFYQNLIWKWLRRKGWTAEIEMTLKNKRVDVGARRGPTLNAYEVVNEGIEKEISNLKLDLEDGWQAIVFCIGNADIQSQLCDLIEVAVGAQILKNVEVKMLPSFR